jgi:hypothetical protein
MILHLYNYTDIEIKLALLARIHLMQGDRMVSKISCSSSL